MHRIIIKRDMASGDVLLAAGVAPPLKAKYPEAQIVFCTKTPNVLMGNPYIDVVTEHFEPHPADLIVDLNLAYERQPSRHIIDCYAEVAGVRPEQCRFYVQTEPLSIPALAEVDYVVMHAGQSDWVGRLWLLDRWREIALRFHMHGIKVVCIGTGKDRFVSSDVDLRGAGSLAQVAFIIQNAALFVGVDSLPMHLAQVLGTPGLAFFGSIHPELRLIDQSSVEAVTVDDLPCLGCHHRREAPTIATQSCETGTLACETELSVERFWDAIVRRCPERFGCPPVRSHAEALQWAKVLDDKVRQEAQKVRAALSDIEAQICQFVPAGHKFVFIDDQQSGLSSFGNRIAIPCMERDGIYWGPPTDGPSAVLELERQHRLGATHVVIASCSYWWLAHYPELTHYLQHRAHKKHEDSNFAVFECVIALLSAVFL